MTEEGPGADDSGPSSAGWGPILRFLVTSLKVVYALRFAALLLPLGPEGDRTVRRHPWVSYAIVLLCVAGFQYELLAEPGARWKEAYAKSVAALTEYLREHPCVQAPRDVADLGDSGALKGLREERARACAEQRARSRSREGQPELAGMVAALRSIQRAHPVWRLLERPADGVDLTVLTSMFLHAGWLHLVGNLLFFWSVGPFLEDVYGRLSFAALYLASGVAGGLALRCHDPGSTRFVLGASGAISGVMGAFLVRFTSRRLRLLTIPFPWVPLLHYRFSVPAYLVLVCSFLEDLLGAHSGLAGIAWWAHIGGFSFGVVFAFAFKRLRIEEQHVAPGIERRIAYYAHPALVRAMEMRLQGRYRAARRGVELALAARPDDLDAWRERYEIAMAEGKPAEAGLYATRLVGLYVQANEPQLAARFVETVLEQVGPHLAPRFYLVAGAQMASLGEVSLAGRLRESLRRRQPDHPGVPLTPIREARSLERHGAAQYSPCMPSS
jgi:membrane associated rhomboid family serine protease